MTLYEALNAAGCDIDHHESDMYVRYTLEAAQIIAGYGVWRTLSIGTDGKVWAECPFMYDPYWTRVEVQT